MELDLELHLIIYNKSGLCDKNFQGLSYRVYESKNMIIIFDD